MQAYLTIECFYHILPLITLWNTCWEILFFNHYFYSFFECIKQYSFHQSPSLRTLFFILHLEKCTCNFYWYNYSEFQILICLLTILFYWEIPIWNLSKFPDSHCKNFTLHSCWKKLNPLQEEDEISLFFSFFPSTYASYGPDSSIDLTSNLDTQILFQTWY